MSPSLSQRISSLKPSPTVALNAKASALRADGHKIYNFAVGEPDFTTPDSICQVAIDAQCVTKLGSIQAAMTSRADCFGWGGVLQILPLWAPILFEKTQP